MNLVPFIAEKLGVEIGEEFKLENSDLLIYKFQGTGLFAKANIEDSYWCACKDLTLRDILVGIVKIEKLPFEPKEGERYWVATWDTQETTLTTCGAIWHNRADCYADKYVSNCFRTEAEAEKHKFEIYEKLTGKKWTP